MNFLTKSQSIVDLLGSVSMTSLFRSTLPYRAPELFQVEVGDTISCQTDIWSLGCILYSLIYLEGPFDQHWLKLGSRKFKTLDKNRVPGNGISDKLTDNLVYLCVQNREFNRFWGQPQFFCSLFFPIFKIF